MFQISGHKFREIFGVCYFSFNCIGKRKILTKYLLVFGPRALPNPNQLPSHFKQAQTPNTEPSALDPHKPKFLYKLLTVFVLIPEVRDLGALKDFRIHPAGGLAF
jgi:hypothetical protein